MRRDHRSAFDPVNLCKSQLPDSIFRRLFVLRGELRSVAQPDLRPFRLIIFNEIADHSGDYPFHAAAVFFDRYKISVNLIYARMDLEQFPDESRCIAHSAACS